MQTPLIDLLRGGVPALAAFVAAVVVIRIVCRRPALRRLSFALSVAALTGSVALFRALALHRAATAGYEGRGADRASQLLGLMRRFFELIGGGDVNGRTARD